MNILNHNLLRRISAKRSSPKDALRNYLAFGRWIVGNEVYFFLFLSACFAMFAFYSHNYAGTVKGMWVSISGFLIIYSFASLQQNRVKQILAELKEDEAGKYIGFLVEIAMGPDSELKSETLALLLRCLPHLQASQADRLNLKQRQHLHFALIGSNPQLALAVLNALSTIGDSGVLPYLRKLAQGQWSAARNVEVRNAARTALPVLQAWVDQEAISGTLLRASDAASLPTTTLVRAAMPRNIEVESDHLLRASTSTQREIEPEPLPQTSHSEHASLIERSPSPVSACGPSD